MDNFNQEHDQRNDKIVGERYVNREKLGPERVAARLQEEAEITAREQRDASYRLDPRHLVSTVLNQSAAGDAGAIGKAVEAQTCAPNDPGAYQVEKNALLASLEYRRDQAWREVDKAKDHIREQRDLADRLKRAIQIIALHPEYDLLLELLRLKVL